MRESSTYCDLCGDEVNDGEWGLSLFDEPFHADDEEHMSKDLCKNCKEKVYDELQKFDWKY